jgi:segregation and condensation protein B
MNNLKKNIQAILFISGEPVKMKKLIEILEEKEERIKEMILEIKNDFVEMNHGLTIIENNDCFQISTNSQVSEIVEKFLKNNLKEEISPASLETLSIIAFRGPIIKSEIDNIRGVNSVFILRNLMIRGLIERERDNKKGIFEYKISFDMMKKLGIDKIEDLPDYGKYNSDDNKNNLE